MKGNKHNSPYFTQKYAGMFVLEHCLLLKAPDRETFEFDQGQEIKNQPIIVLALLSESLGIKQ